MSNHTDAVDKMHQDDFFRSHKQVTDVKKELLKNGLTHSNVSQLLHERDYLRLEKDGWIQKRPFSVQSNGNDSNLDIFKILNIHDEIIKTSKLLFNDGYYSQSVFEAMKRIDNIVKEKTKVKLTGKKLMMNVFSKEFPKIKLTKMISDSDIDEQEGYMHIFGGAMQGIRNPKGHENMQITKSRAIELLVLASLLCKKIDESVA